MSYILHLVSADYFNSLAPDTPFLPPGFDRDGFIHCTQGAHLMLEVANTVYRNVPGDFVVLVIDESRLSAPVRYEPPASVGENQAHPGAPTLFPHVYGPIDRDAIVDAVPLRRTTDGTFMGFERAVD